MRVKTSEKAGPTYANAYKAGHRFSPVLVCHSCGITHAAFQIDPVKCKRGTVARAVARERGKEIARKRDEQRTLTTHRGVR